MSTKLALAGNPNCGKTTMFNAMTGASQYVGNWPGVTVEKKEGKLKGHKDVIVTDLPGIYSLSPYTLEEVVSRNYLLNENPDVIVDLLDGTNIERNLYLTTQLLETGYPVVIALNMMDLVKKRGDKIDTSKLSKELGCPVVETTALGGKGLDELTKQAIAQVGKKSTPKHTFSQKVESALQQIEELVGAGKGASSRWYAVKLFERDKEVLKAMNLPANTLKELESITAACEAEFDDDAESIITNERYTYITGVVAKTVKKGRTGDSVSDRIDRIVTNRVLAIPIFAVVMFLIYAIAMGSFPVSIGTMATDWANDTLFGEWIPSLFDTILGALGVSEDGWVYGLIQDGIVAGVGAVLGFVPQMLVLFFLLAILEDIGYMSRIAFIMDRIFRRFGLSGKSFIPMLVATGCGVPGVMASRTIEQERDRRMTIMTTCFMPCGAKMPIIGLFAGALFGGSAVVATSAYFIGIAAVIISGIMLKKLKAFAGEPAPFVMELPAYHVPSPGNVLRATWERGWSFIKRAGTIILASTIILWFLQGFGFTDGSFGMVEDNNTSLLASIANKIAWIFDPLGFGNWKATVASVTGLIAKENVVGTFGVLYGFAEVAEEGDEIWVNIAGDYTKLTAYSFMLFNLLCAPCFAAMGAIKREMNNAKWTWAAIGYMCGFAYVVALCTYQIGGLFTGEVSFNIFTIIAIALIVGIIYMLVRKGAESGSQKLSREAAMNA